MVVGVVVFVVAVVVAFVCIAWIRANADKQDKAKQGKSYRAPPWRGCSLIRTPRDDGLIGAMLRTRFMFSPDSWLGPAVRVPRAGGRR